jgi:hypothetical protein
MAHRHVNTILWGLSFNACAHPLNFDNIAAQRNLNDKGKASAKAFGDAIRQAGVPNIVDALGKDWFDVKEGEASIFRPEAHRPSADGRMASPRRGGEVRADGACEYADRVTAN